MIYQLDEQDIWFPNPEEAEQDGLLAVGGDLSPKRLMLAYHWGIFPWYSDETPILWYSPHERFVIFPEKIRVSKSMRQLLKKEIFTFSFDEDFGSVIDACATSERPDQDGTWITDDMKDAYIRLHHLGLAHSVEVRNENKLVGGLYGVVVGNVFCGESMFSRMSNASKAALIWLCTNKQFQMIDCQFHTSHLESLGAEFISRKDYLEILRKDIVF